MKLIIYSIFLLVCIYTHSQSQTSEQESHKVPAWFTEGVKKLDEQLQNQGKGGISDVSYSGSFGDVYEKGFNDEYVIKGSEKNKLNVIVIIGSVITLIIFAFLMKRGFNLKSTKPIDKKSLAKKIMFFWVVFHSIGYLSFLIDFHPSIETKYEENVVYTNYLLTPECDLYEEKENFYPFHNYFSSGYIGTFVSGEFVGIYGYYGHYEYLLYVVVPLLCIFLVWFYRKYVE